MNSKVVTCSVLENSTAVILPPFRMTCLGERNGMNSHISSRASSICQHNIEIYSGIQEVYRDILKHIEDMQRYTEGMQRHTEAHGRCAEIY